MSVTTKTILFGTRGIDEVAAMVENGYGSPVEIDTAYATDEVLGKLFFDDRTSGRQRTMHVFTSNIGDALDVHSGERTLTMMGASGDAETVMRALLAQTGGFLSVADGKYMPVEPQAEATAAMTPSQALAVSLARIVGIAGMNALRPVIADPEKLEALEGAIADFRTAMHGRLQP